MAATLGVEGCLPAGNADAISWPYMMKRWFTSIGAPPQIDSVGVGLMQKSIEDLLELLALWSTHWIVLQIDASLLQNGSPGITNRHWVTVNPVYPPRVAPAGSQEPSFAPALMTKNPFGSGTKGGAESKAIAKLKHSRMAADVVDMKVVSWSHDWHKFNNPTLGHIASLFYGGYACRRFRG